MFTTPQKVRDVMGLGADEVASDREIEVLIRVAQDEIKRELYRYHYNEEVLGNPNTGSLWDGSNTVFQTSCYPIMDSDNDFIVSNSDISCRWLDGSYNPSAASWSIRNDVWGLVNIYQSDGASAIPSNAWTVCIDYWSCHRKIGKREMEDLASYLTAHLVQGMLTGSTKISLADFQRNIPVIMKSDSEFIQNYRRILMGLQGDSVRGV